MCAPGRQMESGMARMDEAMALAGRAPDFLSRVFQVRESILLNMSE